MKEFGRSNQENISCPDISILIDTECKKYGLILIYILLFEIINRKAFTVENFFFFSPHVLFIRPFLTTVILGGGGGGGGGGRRRQPPIRILQYFLYTVQIKWLTDSLVLYFTD